MEWIKTRDAMPLERERCLAVIQFSDGERVIFGNMWHLRGMWNNPANFGGKNWIVTHWTPYPDLPEE